MATAPVIPTLPTLPPVSPPNVLPGTNTPVPSSTGQGTGVGTIAAPATGISSGLGSTLTQSQPTTNSNSLLGDFQATYGQGTGTALADTLAGLGTATDAAVTSTNQSILNAAGIQQANLEAGDAAAGLSADSSASALALGDFDSQVSQNIASTDSQMELSEENELINALQSEGTAHGPSGSVMGSISDFLTGGGLGVVGDAAGALDQLPGTGGTGLGSTLDILSGL
jgi:sulfur carrier protein ThiS